MSLSLKKLLKPVAVLVGATLISISLSGCPGRVVRTVKADGVCHTDLKIKPASDPNLQIATILAPTSNFVNFESILDYAEPSIKKSLGKDLPDERLKEAIGNELTMIVADGNAQVASKSSVNPIDEDIADDIRSSMDGAVKKIRKVAYCAGVGDGKVVDYDMLKLAGQSDMLKALVAAGNNFSSEAPQHEIYVLGNGIQTTGAIHMQDKNMFPTSEEKGISLANDLYNLDELPVDLYGARVHWIGLGQTDNAKQEIPEAASKGLKAFWQEVIRLSGGILADDDIESSAGNGEADPLAIKVEENIPITVCKLFRLSEQDGLIFKPDSASFVDPAKAKSLAKKVADEYTAKSCSMVITGFAATGSDKKTYLAKKSSIDSKNETLTKQRAQAFASLVRKQGFSNITIGNRSGTCTEWEQTFKTNGDPDDAAQQACRRVEVSNGK